MKYQLTIIGTVGADAEQPEGYEFITFSVASNYKDKDGNQKTIWTDCTHRNVKLLPHIKKGQTLYLEGFPKAQSWLDKDGKPQGKVALSVNHLEFCGGGQKSDLKEKIVDQLVQVDEAQDGLPW